MHAISGCFAVPCKPDANHWTENTPHLFRGAFRRRWVAISLTPRYRDAVLLGVLSAEKYRAGILEGIGEKERWESSILWGIRSTHGGRDRSKYPTVYVIVWSDMTLPSRWRAVIAGCLWERLTVGCSKAIYTNIILFVENTPLIRDPILTGIPCSHLLARSATFP